MSIQREDNGDETDDAAVSSSVLLVDTTLFVDRRKMPERRIVVDRLLKSFGFSFTTCISQLEFKAVLIQQCMTLHNILKDARSLIGTRDRFIEVQHPQTRLRSHIFNNLLQIFPPPGCEYRSPEDQECADKARLALENIIPMLYVEFGEGLTGGIQRGKIQCNRAAEPPLKKTTAFAANIPDCVRGKNKTCNVEGFIRGVSDDDMYRIERAAAGLDQMTKGLEVLNDVRNDSRKELSNSDCRRAGDCLIVLEGIEMATHTASTNQRDWGPLSVQFGREIAPVDYNSIDDDV